MLSTRASISAKTLATAASVGIMLPSESNEAICIGHANKCNRKQSKREMQTGTKQTGNANGNKANGNKANGTSPLPPFTRGRLTIIPLPKGETYFYPPWGVHIHSPPCEGGRGMFHRICKQKQNGIQSNGKQKQTKTKANGKQSKRNIPPTPLHKGESGCVKFVLW